MSDFDIILDKVIQEEDDETALSNLTREEWIKVYVLSMLNHFVGIMTGGLYEITEKGERCLKTYFERNDPPTDEEIKKVMDWFVQTGMMGG